MIIADTNVVSEFMKDSPDPAVLAWAQDIGPADLTICIKDVYVDKTPITYDDVASGAEPVGMERVRKSAPVTTCSANAPNIAVPVTRSPTAKSAVWPEVSVMTP